MTNLTRKAAGGAHTGVNLIMVPWLTIYWLDVTNHKLCHSFSQDKQHLGWFDQSLSPHTHTQSCIKGLTY